MGKVRDVRSTTLDPNPSGRRVCITTGGNPFGSGHRWERNVKQDMRWERREAAIDGFIGRLGKAPAPTRPEPRLFVLGGQEYLAPNRQEAEKAYHRYLKLQAKRAKRKGKRGAV